MPPANDEFPFELSTSRWRTARGMVMPLLIGLAVSFWPVLADRGHVIDHFVHGSAIWVTVFVAGFLAVIIALLPPASLTIAPDGITYRLGPRTYTYAWRDITAVEPAKIGPRLIVLGRSDRRNVYNVLPATRFDVTPARLTEVVRDGLARFAAAPGGQSATPGDDAERIVTADARRMILIFAIMWGAAAIAFVATQGSTYRHTMALRVHGEHATGHVERLYIDSCSHGRCTTNVDYGYVVWVGAERRSYHGRGSVTQADRDPAVRVAWETHVVPIVYDTTHPATSALNFGDVVFRHDPAKAMAMIFAIVGGISGGVIGGFMLLFWLTARSECRKLAAEG